MIIQFADLYYGTENDTIENEDATGISKKKDISIEEELAKEIESLKSEVKNKKQRFRWEDIGCKSIVFVAVNNDKIEPTQFIKRMIDDMRKNKKTNEIAAAFKSSHRVIPIISTCYAKEEEIKEVLKTVLENEWNDKSEKKLVRFFFVFVHISQKKKNLSV